ncbi:MAG: protein kinase [Myxococcales bacterium]|nr:protein kinase [Myxococcales bacterium]
MPPLIALDDWIEPESTSGLASSSPQSSGPAPGTVIGGSYRIVGPLGTGAMGIVLLAHDERLDRRVAIKCTHDHLLSDSFRERFISEARAMARVNHPNVVQVHAFGEHEGAPYFVMEYVEGPTLEQWLAASKSPPELHVALRILDELCLGVAAIHAADTVHHDIKPSNVLLDAQLRPRVADLGLAVFFRQDGPAEREIVGTPTYMAPEIAFSKELDPKLRSRADVYSVACVAYQLLTGRPPFDGLGNIGMLLQHAMKPAEPPSSLRPDLPSHLDGVILRALAKDPRNRTPTVEQFRRDLAAAIERERDPVCILVAEDDDDFREALKLFLALEFPTAEIECVRDGSGALQVVDRRAPSVAIVDLRMPGIDGMELTGLLRARTSSATMPIIILTASGGAEEWRRLSALGADRFLLKPVVMDDLAALVRRVLGERSQAGGASSRHPVA